MNLEHDVFLNGVAKVSQGFLLHVVDCTSVSNGEVGVGSGDGVIQSVAGYNKLVERDLGEDEKNLLQVEK
jgi:hypothetical protein